MNRDLKLFGHLTGMILAYFIYCCFINYNASLSPIIGMIVGYLICFYDNKDK